MSAKIQPVEVHRSAPPDVAVSNNSGFEKFLVFMGLFFQWFITMLLLYMGIAQGYTAVPVTAEDFKLNRALAASKIVTPDYVATCWKEGGPGCGGKIRMGIAYIVIFALCALYCFKTMLQVFVAWGFVSKDSFMGGCLNPKSKWKESTVGQKVIIVYEVVASVFARCGLGLYWLDVALQILQCFEVYSKQNAFAFSLQAFLIAADIAMWTVAFAYENELAGVLTETLADVCFMTLLVLQSGELSPHTLVDPVWWGFILSVVPASSVFLLGAVIGQVLNKEEQEPATQEVTKSTKRKRMFGIFIAVLVSCGGIALVVIGIAKGGKYSECTDNTAWKAMLPESGFECLESSFNLYQNPPCDCKAMDVDLDRVPDCDKNKPDNTLMGADLRPRLEPLMYLNFREETLSETLGLVGESMYDVYKGSFCKLGHETVQSIGDMTELRILNLGFGAANFESSKTLRAQGRLLQAAGPIRDRYGNKFEDDRYTYKYELPLSWSNLTALNTLTMEMPALSSLPDDIVSNWENLNNFECAACFRLTQLPTALLELPSLEKAILADSPVCAKTSPTPAKMSCTHGTYSCPDVGGLTGMLSELKKASDRSSSVCADQCQLARDEWNTAYAYSKVSPNEISLIRTVDAGVAEDDENNRPKMMCVMNAIYEVEGRTDKPKDPHLSAEQFMKINTGISTCQDCNWYKQLGNGTATNVKAFDATFSKCNGFGLQCPDFKGVSDACLGFCAEFVNVWPTIDEDVSMGIGYAEMAKFMNKRLGIGEEDPDFVPLKGVEMLTQDHWDKCIVPQYKDCPQVMMQNQEMTPDFFFIYAGSATGLTFDQATTCKKCSNFPKKQEIGSPSCKDGSADTVSTFVYGDDLVDGMSMPQGWLDIEAAKLASPAPAPVDNDVFFSQWCIANDCEFAEIREDEGEDKSIPDAKAKAANITCSRISSRFKLALSYGDLEKAKSYRCGSIGSWPTVVSIHCAATCTALEVANAQKEASGQWPQGFELELPGDDNRALSSWCLANAKDCSFSDVDASKIGCELVKGKCAQVSAAVAGFCKGTCASGSGSTSTGESPSSGAGAPLAGDNHDAMRIWCLDNAKDCPFSDKNPNDIGCELANGKCADVPAPVACACKGTCPSASGCDKVTTTGQSSTTGESTSSSSGGDNHGAMAQWCADNAAQCPFENFNPNTMGCEQAKGKCDKVPAPIVGFCKATCAPGSSSTTTGQSSTTGQSTSSSSGAPLAVDNHDAMRQWCLDNPKDCPFSDKNPNDIGCELAKGECDKVPAPVKGFCKGTCPSGSGSTTTGAATGDNKASESTTTGQNSNTGESSSTGSGKDDHQALSTWCLDNKEQCPFSDMPPNEIGCELAKGRCAEMPAPASAVCKATCPPGSFRLLQATATPTENANCATLMKVMKRSFMQTTGDVTVEICKLKSFAKVCPGTCGLCENGKFKSNKP